MSIHYSTRGCFRLVVVAHNTLITVLWEVWGGLGNSAVGDLGWVREQFYKCKK